MKMCALPQKVIILLMTILVNLLFQVRVLLDDQYNLIASCETLGNSHRIA